MKAWLFRLGFLFSGIGCCAAAWAEEESALPFKDAGPPPASLSPPKSSEALRPFDETIYSVSYEAFLDAGNPQEAYGLAEAAVRQRPNLIAWRKRLAQTAEWTGRPSQALEQWEYIETAEPRAESYRQTIRLAGMLNDHRASIRAWEGLGRLQALDFSESTALVREYEEQGEPAKAVKFLQDQILKSPGDSLSRSLAELEERMGREDAALGTLETMSRRFGNTPRIALARAKILCRHGRMAQATSVLESIRGPIPEGQNELWYYRAVTLYARQDYRGAMNAYKMIFRSGNYELEDVQSLVELAVPRDSTLALQAAVAGWKKFHYPDFLIYYLERCLNVERWDYAAAALDRLSPQALGLFTDIPYFFDLASRIHQYEGRGDLARDEMLRALQLDPESQNLRAGLLWLLIEQGRRSELEEYTRRWDAGSGLSPTLMLPLAMAHKLQNQVMEGLAYFRRMDDESMRKDFPFLFNYAELLEASGDGENARRLYLRAQAALEDATARGAARGSRDWQEAEARWAWKFGSGDIAERRIKDLLNVTRYGEGSKELALSWEMDLGENPEDAMAVLQANSDRSQAFPAWAELSVALRRDDVHKVKELLDTQAESLTPADKASAATFLGDRERALGFANEGLAGESAPQGRESLEGLMREGLDAQRSSVEVTSNPYFMERKALLSGNVPMGTQVALTASAESSQRPRLSESIPLSVPSREDIGRLSLDRNTGGSLTQISAGVRQAGSWSRSARGEEHSWTGGVRQEWKGYKLPSLSLEYAHGAIAEESPLLTLFAMKDAWRALASLSLPYRANLALRADRDFLYDLNRRFLGSGTLWKADLSQTPIRPLTIGVESAYQKFQAVPGQANANGTSTIAGWLPAIDFPQSCWQAVGHMEWGREDAAVNRPFDYFAGVESGVTRFLRSLPVQTDFWEPYIGLRGGVSIQPIRRHRLSLAYSYSRGTLPVSGQETVAKVQYEYLLR